MLTLLSPNAFEILPRSIPSFYFFLIHTEYIEMARTQHSSHVVSSDAGPFAAILDENGNHVQAVKTTLVNKTKSLTFLHLFSIMSPFDLKY